MLDLVVRSTVVLGAAWVLAAVVMRRRSAAARHAVWTAAMGCVLALPALAAVGPRWGVLPAWGGGGTAMRLEAADLASLGAGGSAGVMPVEGGAAGAERSAGGLLDGVPWSAVLGTVWGAGSLLLLMPAVIGRVALHRTERGSRRVTDERWLDLLARARRELGVSRPVAMLIGGAGVMPMTWGLGRARVLLPREAALWGDDRRLTVLRHELAHVRRCDCTTDLLAQVARAVCWFNPLAWVAVARMRAERERACDDLVLGLGVRQSAYAEELVAAAQGLRVGMMGAAAMAMARPSQLSGRVRDILDERKDRRMVSMRQAAAVGVVLGVVAIVAACAGTRAGGTGAPTQSAAEPPRTPELGGEGWQDVPIYKSSIRMRRIVMAAHEYARGHDGAMPPDLGSLLAYIPEEDDEGRVRTARERAALFLSPADEARIMIPAEPTPEWVNTNSSFAYLGNPEVRVRVLPDWSTTVMLIERAPTGYRSEAPGLEGMAVFPVAFVDTHTEIWPKDQVDRAVAMSGQVWQAARGVAPGPRPRPEAAEAPKPASLGSAIRTRNLLVAIHNYAEDHKGRMPADLGSLILYMPSEENGRRLSEVERLRGFLSPRDEAKVKLPERPSAEWVNKNTSYVYLGRGDILLGDVPDRAATVLLHEKSAEPYPDTARAGVVGMLPLGFADGHVEAVLAGDVKGKVEESKRRIDAAGREGGGR